MEYRAILGKVVPQFKNALYENTYRITNFEICRKKLYSFFDENNILHCSLKGIVTKDLYPHFAMRFLADYDVLFDPQYQKQVRDWYAENEAEILYFRESRYGEKEDSVMLNKHYHFELHYCLLNDWYKDEPWFDYFSNEKLFARLIHVSGSEYKMSNEDFYLFFLIHSFKHSASVCDIREMIDCYLINKKMPYNTAYVSKKLSEFGLEGFEHSMRCVGKKLIEGEKLSKEEECYFLKSAKNKTFGDLELNELRRIANGENITLETRKTAIKNIFITPTSKYKNAHPLVYRLLFLRPIYHFSHIITRLLRWKETKQLIEKYKTID